jgi:phosphatidate cytidylyltransferase
MSELVQRVWTGGIAICLLIVGLILLEESWFPPIVAAALAILASIGYWEYCNFARSKGFAPAIILGIIATWVYMAVCLMGVYPSLRREMPVGVAQATVLALTAFAFLIQFLIRRNQPLASLAMSVFGFLYVVIPLSLAIDILYYLPSYTPLDGRWWIIFVVGVTVFTDMGAYFVGKAIGRHRLAPAISPGKTIEGTVGGIIVGVISGLIIRLFNWFDISWTGAFLLALGLSIVGQVGDLGESLFKRDAGVKDSNRLPGLGGVLDVLDSLLVNLPATFLTLRWMVEAHR